MYHTVEFNVFAEHLDDVVFGDLRLKNSPRTNQAEMKNDFEPAAQPIPKPAPEFYKELDYRKNQQDK